MYDPISGNDDDQYIELYNQRHQHLSAWPTGNSTSGVSFTFPPGTTLGAGQLTW